MAVFIVGTTVIGAAVLVAGLIDRRGTWVRGLSRAWGRLMLAACGVRLEVEGADRIDAKAAYVFAGNHQSALDIPVLLAALPNRFGWLAKKELFRIPLFGRLMRLTGNIPVDRGEARAALHSLREAVRALEEGRSIFVFPEGTRSPTEEVLPFKSGGFMLAAHSGLPVVPVTIVGTGRVLPPGRWRLGPPGPVRVVIGEPVAVSGRRRDELARLVRERVIENYCPRRESLGADNHG